VFERVCRVVLLAGVVAACALAPAFGQVVKIADEEVELIETPHPYPTGSAEGEIVWQRTIHWPDASYIKVHFDRFELAPGDRLVLRDPDGKYEHVYTGRGFQDRGGDFWGLSILGDTMELTLLSFNPQHQSFGLAIDRWAHGYPLDQQPPGTEALCGTEDFRDIECYKDSYPEEYDRSRAAVRLIKNGSAHCTGWLATCENHIVTNEHCVGSQSELDDIEFQFEYKRPECGTGSADVELQLQGGTLLEMDAGLDYAYIMPQLDGNDPQADYGFFQWETELPAIDEFMYIPGHPSGDPKRLSIESTHPEDQSGRCEVYSTDEPACTGGPVPDVGYFCDTEGGSSGSPVVSSETHRVIALHHCANCPNRGVPIRDVYNDIQGSEHPLPDCVTCTPPPAPQDLVASTPEDNVVTLDWEPVEGAVLYRIYRNDDGCDQPMVEVGTSTEPRYRDEEVAGSITYYYEVTAESECGAESPPSNCESVQPTGVCSAPPRFDGLVSAESSEAGDCGIELTWNEGSGRCGDIVYNVYRSTFADFEPSDGNMIASCLTTTSYTDADVLAETRYHYLVRAEDDTGDGTGPCYGGNVEHNEEIHDGRATGPRDVFFYRGFETDSSGWALSGEWQIAVPRGAGGPDGGGQGNPDPEGAADGFYALGHDLTGAGDRPGNYENGLSTPEIALSPVFDATGRDEVRLRFLRWLGTHGSPGDQASVDVYDGSDWTNAWSNDSTAIYDDAWVEVDVDITDGVAGAANAQLRFSQGSDGSGVACGWNVDQIEVYEPAACASDAIGVSPVPDGAWAPGAPMTSERGSGDAVTVRWDVSRCDSPGYHLFVGDQGTLANLGYNDARCDLGAGGEASVELPTPSPGGLTWWVVAGADGTVEGIHGYDSAGGVRGADAGGQCGLTDQDTSGVCRP
jgi:hypothetical protein